MDHMDIAAKSLKESKLMLLKFKMSKKVKEERKEEKEGESKFKNLVQNINNPQVILFWVVLDCH